MERVAYSDSDSGDGTEIEGVVESASSTGSASGSDSPGLGERLRVVEEPYQLSDHQLMELPIRDLNNMLKNLDKDTAARLKRRRRTLKNRGYAQSCRSRRVTTTSQLEKAKAELERSILNTSEELSCVRQERDWYKRQLLAVIKTNGSTREQLKTQLMAILREAETDD